MLTERLLGLTPVSLKTVALDVTEAEASGCSKEDEQYLQAGFEGCIEPAGSRGVAVSRHIPSASGRTGCCRSLRPGKVTAV